MERSGARGGKSRRRFTCHIDDLNGVLYEGFGVLCNRLVLRLLDCVFVASLVVEIVTCILYYLVTEPVTSMLYSDMELVTFLLEATAMLKSFDLDFDYNTD